MLLLPNHKIVQNSEHLKSIHKSLGIEVACETKRTCLLLDDIWDLNAPTFGQLLAALVEEFEGLRDGSNDLRAKRGTSALPLLSKVSCSGIHNQISTEASDKAQAPVRNPVIASHSMASPPDGRAPLRLQEHSLQQRQWPMKPTHQLKPINQPISNHIQNQQEIKTQTTLRDRQ